MESPTASKTEYVEDRVARRDMRQPLSQAQRARVWEIREESRSPPMPFPEGLSPELHRASTCEELLKLLIEKVSLFIGKLGYDPENITVPLSTLHSSKGLDSPEAEVLLVASRRDQSLVDSGMRLRPE